MAGLLAACGGGSHDAGVTEPAVKPSSTTSSTISESTSSSTSTTTTIPASSTTTAVDPPSVDFQSPSGNIHCRIDAVSAACSYAGDAWWEAGGDLPYWADGLSFDLEKAGCADGGFRGFEVVVEPPEPAARRTLSICAVEDQLVDEPERTLGYGDEIAVGELRCMSTEVGVGCRHEGGEGFVVARREFSILLGPGDGWQTAAGPIATTLATAETGGPEMQGQVIVATHGAKCVMNNHEAERWVSAECTSTSPINAAWTPGGASCKGADFNGLYLSPAFGDGYSGATIGCTTDVSPLQDPTLTAAPARAGDVWQVGPALGCGSPDGIAMLCWNDAGDGFHVTDNELSFFFDAFS